MTDTVEGQLVVTQAERRTPALHEGGRFRDWSTVDLSAQCLSQAREQLDPEYTQFMTAVAERLATVGTRPDAGKWVMVPREPTEAMLEAGLVASFPRAPGAVWSAMLAVLPSVSGEGK